MYMAGNRHGKLTWIMQTIMCLGVAVGILSKLKCPRPFAITSSMSAYDMRYYLDCIWGQWRFWHAYKAGSRRGESHGSHLKHGDSGKLLRILEPGHFQHHFLLLTLQTYTIF